MSNTLIVYYSHSGNTRKMAKIIAEQLHADCLEIIPQKPYPQAYNAVNSRGARGDASGSCFRQHADCRRRGRGALQPVYLLPRFHPLTLLKRSYSRHVSVPAVTLTNENFLG